MTSRACEHCGSPLVRQVYSSKRAETEKHFAERRFCGDGCLEAAGADRCLEPGCPRRRYCKGRCAGHYARLRSAAIATGPIRGDDPNALSARFWSYVRRGLPNECWPWASELNSKGYGRFRVYTGGKLRRILAHRFAYQQATGRALRRGLVVMHSCDNPPCCNPKHLRCGTQRDNMADARVKGRAVPPPARWRSGLPSSRLQEADIPEIRSRLRRGETQRSIARDYKVSPSAIGAVARGRTWFHVPDVLVEVGQRPVAERAA